MKCSTCFQDCEIVHPSGSSSMQDHQLADQYSYRRQFKKDRILMIQQLYDSNKGWTHRKLAIAFNLPKNTIKNSLDKIL